MIKISDENFYKRTLTIKYMFLIDKNGAISGEAMRQLKDRMPEQIKDLKRKMEQHPPQLGSCYSTYFCFFIVCRESYRSKWNEATFEQIWSAVVSHLSDETPYKIDTEDYPWIEQIITKYDNNNLNLTICNHSEWSL